MRRLALPWLLLVASSCVQVTWERHDVQAPVEARLEAELEAGQADLAACLARLGAPLLVWELGDGGFAMAYGWDKQREYGVSLSVPVADTAGSASFNYNDVKSRLHGVVLVFDADWVLLRKERGYLKDLIPTEALQPPAFLEDE